jgi:Flp pilus assembly protein TadB
VWIVVLLVAVASRPIEVRLWRAGHLSDRVVTILLLSRMPLLALLAVMLLGGSLVISLVILAAATLLPILFYRYVLGIVREQHQSS